MRSIIDLHTHSHVSDGSYSVKELVRQASKNNIKVLALTDHDSIAGVEEAKVEALKYDIEIISGIEISAVNNEGRMIHLIGLGMDITSDKFLTPYYKMKKAREGNVDSVIKYVNEQLNISIDREVLKKGQLDKFLSRHDIHRYIVDNKILNNSKIIWNKYLDKVPYEDGELIPIDVAIRMIKEAGGLSFLAHYNNKSTSLGYLDKEKIEAEIMKLKSLGLDGVERYYPTFNDDDIKYLDYLIEKYNLVYSGGTDFHGVYRANNDIGIGDGDFFVPFDVYLNMKNKIK